jgi:hypothetical protein
MSGPTEYPDEVGAQGLVSAEGWFLRVPVGKQARELGDCNYT